VAFPALRRCRARSAERAMSLRSLGALHQPDLEEAPHRPGRPSRPHDPHQRDDGRHRRMSRRGPSTAKTSCSTCAPGHSRGLARSRSWPTTCCGQPGPPAIRQGSRARWRSFGTRTGTRCWKRHRTHAQIRPTTAPGRGVSPNGCIAGTTSRSNTGSATRGTDIRKLSPARAESCLSFYICARR
jgi:hypothetical protein